MDSVVSEQQHTLTLSGRIMFNVIKAYDTLTIYTVFLNTVSAF